MPEIKPPIKIMALERGPGPGVYGLPPTVGYEHHDFTKYRHPAYTIGLPTPIARKFTGPGPCHSIKPGTTRYGPTKKSPGCTIAEKLQSLRAFGSPGPGAYSPEKCKKIEGPTAPAYTISKRAHAHRVDTTPSPNYYSLPSTIGTKVPNKETAAAYTMIARRPEHIKFTTPGPAAYGAPNLYTYKLRPPRYTIATKIRLPGPNFPKPGPAAYYPPSRTIQRPSRITFGIRHSEYTTPLIAEN